MSLEGKPLFTKILREQIEEAHGQRPDGQKHLGMTRQGVDVSKITLLFQILARRDAKLSTFIRSLWSRVYKDHRHLGKAGLTNQGRRGSSRCRGYGRVHIDHNVLQETISNEQRLGYETAETIEEGLRWGQQKAELLLWVWNNKDLSVTQRRYLKYVALDGLTYRQAGTVERKHASTIYRGVKRAIRVLQRAAQRDGLTLEHFSVAHSRLQIAS